MAMMMAAATAVQVFRCKRCDRPIADWDGEHITVEHSGGGGVAVYIEIPGPRAVVKCHHVVTSYGRRVPCGEINRLAAGSI